MKQCTIVTPIGRLLIQEENGLINKIELTNEEIICETSPALLKAETQIQEYFAHQRTSFSLPLKPQGTEFQKKVWNILQNIPYGETLSYQDVAMRIHHPKASRAVGRACHCNPILLMIPCHRVIGKNGQMVGFGIGISHKEYLLNLEKKKAF